jgi:hypothetical protein
MQPKKCYIGSPIKISITRPVTGMALEMFPVADTALTADMASLAGIGRINQNQRYTSLKSLIAQKFSELIECPTIDTPSLVSPYFLVNILSDPLKIFQSYLSWDLLGSGHNCFADFMVNLSLIAALLSRKSLLKLSASSPRTSCTFGSFLLENCSHRMIVFLDLLNGLPAKLLTFRSYSDICNTKINAKNLIGMGRFRGFALGLDVDVILRSFLAERCAGWYSSLKSIPLEVSEDQLDSLTGSEKSKANRFILLSEGENSRIIIDTGGFKDLDDRIILHSSFAVASNPIDGPNSEVSRQTKHRPDIPVNNMVKFNAIPNDSRNGLIDPITSIGKSLQSILYLGDLVGGRGHLATCGQYKFSHLEVV